MDRPDRLESDVGRTSLTMFLSAVRIRLIYSPFYRWLRPLSPWRRGLQEIARAASAAGPDSRRNPKPERQSPNT
jgi:hypothetical protein